MTVDHLALLVVYVIRDDDGERLLQIHLDRIRRHTTVPYRIYAATPRVTPAAAATLAAAADVEVCDTPPCAEFGSREHAHHLDALLARAQADGPTHIGTLDLDSFPITTGWHDGVLEGAPAPGIAAVLRRENLDTVLTHPSGLLLPADFVAAHPFSFTPDSDGTPEFRRFLRTTGQPADTGIRLAYLLHREGIPWRALERSNRHDLHPVIAGVYADAIFHVGGGLRTATRFRRDLAASRVHRLTRPIERVPTPRPELKRAKTALLDTIRRRPERAFVARNRRAAETARRCLDEDADAFVAYLLGRGPAPAALAGSSTADTGPPHQGTRAS
jgi:hypothetical protein